MSKVQKNHDAGTYHPGTSGFGIRTFKCPACEKIHQRVIEFADPMKSRKTAGWLKSELRAPT
jgi:hypothetical protein